MVAKGPDGKKIFSREIDSQEVTSSIVYGTQIFMLKLCHKYATKIPDIKPGTVIQNY